MFTSPTLTIDLAAITSNWQLLRTRFSGKETGAVVKANAYGLGAAQVATALENAGCHSFFVATLDEALELRKTLPDVRILVFHGVQLGEEFAFAQHRIIPVLNSLEQLHRWRAVALLDRNAISALHIDTAMARLGLSLSEFSALRDSELLKQCRVSLLMSHLACASTPQHPLNSEQHRLFKDASTPYPLIPRSLCNSGGILLGQDYHCDLARPGCALYGIHPEGIAGDQNLLTPVATLCAPIIQLRTIDREQTLGYGASITVKKGTRTATIACGYADGYLRSLSHNSSAMFEDYSLPLLGRVTMDMLTFDVSRVPESKLHAGAMLTLIGEGISVDSLADKAQTIGYEILTRMGSRIKRDYI